MLRTVRVCAGGLLAAAFIAAVPAVETDVQQLPPPIDVVAPYGGQKGPGLGRATSREIRSAAMILGGADV
jgi:hypothetical protein